MNPTGATFSLPLRVPPWQKDYFTPFSCLLMLQRLSWDLLISHFLTRNPEVSSPGSCGQPGTQTTSHSAKTHPSVTEKGASRTMANAVEEFPSVGLSLQHSPPSAASTASHIEACPQKRVLPSLPCTRKPNHTELIKKITLRNHTVVSSGYRKILLWNFSCNRLFLALGGTQS